MSEWYYQRAKTEYAEISKTSEAELGKSIHSFRERVKNFTLLYPKDSINVVKSKLY